MCIHNSHFCRIENGLSDTRYASYDEISFYISQFVADETNKSVCFTSILWRTSHTYTSVYGLRVEGIKKTSFFAAFSVFGCCRFDATGPHLLTCGLTIYHLSSGIGTKGRSTISNNCEFRRKTRITMHSRSTHSTQSQDLSSNECSTFHGRVSLLLLPFLSRCDFECWDTWM